MSVPESAIVIAENQLPVDEGKKKFPYKDTVGKITIGIGWNLTDRGLPDAIIQQLFEISLNEAVEEVHTSIPWAISLSEARRAVLYNMAFNIGINGLLGFRQFLGALKLGNYELAAKNMLDSLWARQVGQRAQRLAQEIREG